MVQLSKGMQYAGEWTDASGKSMCHSGADGQSPIQGIHVSNDLLHFKTQNEEEEVAGATCMFNVITLIECAQLNQAKKMKQSSAFTVLQALVELFFVVLLRYKVCYFTW